MILRGIGWLRWRLLSEVRQPFRVFLVWDRSIAIFGMGGVSLVADVYIRFSCTMDMFWMGLFLDEFMIFYVRACYI
jgi:hypothetical protein